MAYNYTESDILRYTPKSPGVYRIYNRILGVYVGEAENMEERLLRHCRGYSDKSGCIDSNSNPKQCEHEVVYGENRPGWRKRGNGSVDTALSAERDPQEQSAHQGAAVLHEVLCRGVSCPRCW